MIFSQRVITYTKINYRNILMLPYATNQAKEESCRQDLLVLSCPNQTQSIVSLSLRVPPLPLPLPQHFIIKASSTRLLSSDFAFLASFFAFCAAFSCAFFAAFLSFRLGSEGVGAEAGTSLGALSSLGALFAFCGSSFFRTGSYSGVSTLGRSSLGFFSPTLRGYGNFWGGWYKPL